MSASTTQIINNGASLKIITDGDSRNILKQQIREISIINSTVIRLDIGLGALNNIFITFSEVTAPVTANPTALAEAINTMLLSSEAGEATAPNQELEISELQKIKTSLLFNEPQVTDETVPKTIFRGYSVPGSLTTAPVWAIQKIFSNHGITTYLWAGGNKNFDKVWENRASLTYA